MATYTKKSKKPNPTKASIATIDKHISTGTFSRVYVLYGPERYLITSYRDALKKSLINADDTMNFTSYNSDNFNLNSVINDAITMPFFAEHRVVVVDGSKLFEGSEDGFIDELSQMPESNVLIFCEEKVNGAKKAFKHANANELFTCLEFQTPMKDDLVNWLGRILGQDGLRVKLSVPEKLLEACGPNADMYTLSNEARKLHDYCLDKGMVTSDDVALVCSDSVEDQVFEMCRAISQGNSNQALKLYNDLLELKRSPVNTINRIADQYKQLLTVSYLLSEGKGVGAVASELKVTEYIASKLISLSKSMPRKKIIKSVDKCYEAIYLNNSGGLIKNDAIENLIVSLLLD